MAAGCVIVGAGQAGFEAAAALRTEGYQDPITLFGDEPHLPYQRPPLSKGFILDKQGMDEIELRPQAFFTDHRIDLVTGTRVTAIERRERRVRLASGPAKPYDALVLACGARNRRLPVDGAALDGVRYLRTLDESIDVKQRLQDASGIVVVGGGFIGLEIAASARSLGKQVTVLEAQPRLMPRVVAPLVSAFYDALHTDRGVTVVCNASVCEISGEGGCARSVRLANGVSYPADLVIVGIGVVPTRSSRATPASTPATASSWTTTCRRAIRRSSRSVTARTIPIRTPAPVCGSSLCRTPRIKGAPLPPRSPDGARRTTPSRGSGPISSTFDCRWRGCRRVMTRP